jgi:ribosomal protein S18 acetylase RimI-like enzyme
LRTGLASDERRAINTIVLAFATDPVARWIWPDPDRYFQVMPLFTRAFAGGAFTHGSALSIDDYTGVALWLPPGAHPDEEAVGTIVEESVSPAVREDFYTLLEYMAACHPREPHWYLPMIGVDPAHQGHGHGGALLAHALELCDSQHMPAYLESTNPRNISLYRRYGFEVVRPIGAGGSPPVVPMIRRAR